MSDPLDEMVDAMGWHPEPGGDKYRRLMFQWLQEATRRIQQLEEREMRQSHGTV